MINKKLNEELKEDILYYKKDIVIFSVLLLLVVVGCIYTMSLIEVMIVILSFIAILLLGIVNMLKFYINMYIKINQEKKK